ncbi:unnamed protein product, partial [Symbiodinium sp. CCMP2456]
DFELQQVKDSLEAVQAQRGRCVRQLGPRTPQELADVESLQSRTGFLSDLVNRFEDKTMALEKELKEMREDRAVGAVRQKLAEDAARQSAEALQQSKEEVESVKLLLRDTKKEHNKRVQDLLKQIQLARGRRTDTKLKEEQERLERLQDELRELKDLNGRLVERLGHERAEHAGRCDSVALSRRYPDRAATLAQPLGNWRLSVSCRNRKRSALVVLSALGFAAKFELSVLDKLAKPRRTFAGLYECFSVCQHPEQLIVLAEVNDNLDRDFAGWQSNLIYVALQALRLSLYRIGMCLAVQQSHENSSSQCFAYGSGDGTAIQRVVRPVAEKLMNGVGYSRVQQCCHFLLYSTWKFTRNAC